ncbi:unnamed protein product [Camellia sinensis]
MEIKGFEDYSTKGMMYRDMVNPPELPIDDISSPLSAQIFELCDPELFPEPLQNSEVTSTSNNTNCCYEDNTPYPTNLSFPPDITNLPYTTVHDKTTTSTTPNTPTTTTPTANNNRNLSAIFDSPEELENDISVSIDFSPFLTNSNQQDQFDPSSLQSQTPLTDTTVVVNGLSQYPPDSVVPLLGPPLPSFFEEECLSLIPSYMHLNSSSSGPPCIFVDATDTMGPYLPGNLRTTLSADSSGIFSGSMYMGNEMQNQELEYQSDNGGIFCQENLPRIYNSCELQALSNESQHGVNGGAGSSTPLASEISSLEDSTFKVGKLSVEQRKEKIHRYMKKRNERNFSKKIKYACRKTLADSRPRVRGRFAKNDELSETHKATCSNHEEDTDEDSLQVVAKEEEDMVDSLDIFAHISGVNSFKCNYPIQSWI